ncbi:MAG: ABC transporter permease [Planctomycetota bacterium]
MKFSTLLIKNLMRRKTRTLLTVAGVAIAIGATVALLGITDGFERSMRVSLEFRGTDVVVTAANVIDQLTSDLDQSFSERFLEIPGVQAVGAALLEVVAHSTDATDISLLLEGWLPGSFLFDDLEMVEGRQLSAKDRRKVMLGVNLAENLSLDVGDSLILQRTEFEVVGVFRSLSVFENGAVVMPLAELQEIMLREGSVTGFSLVLAPEAGVDASEVCTQINALRDENGRSLGLAAMPTREYVSDSTHIRMAHGMAWVTSIIAVVVGAVGTLNTMIMSVAERIREIAILRAIGWRKSRIVRMIMGESVLISLAGAFLGLVSAAVLIRWLSRLPQASNFLEGEIAAGVFAKGLSLALLVGLIGGIYPALRAAWLPPAEGLRHD